MSILKIEKGSSQFTGVTFSLLTAKCLKLYKKFNQSSIFWDHSNRAPYMSKISTNRNKNLVQGVALILKM